MLWVAGRWVGGEIGGFEGGWVNRWVGGWVGRTAPGIQGWAGGRVGGWVGGWVGRTLVSSTQSRTPPERFVQGGAWPPASTSGPGHGRPIGRRGGWVGGWVGESESMLHSSVRSNPPTHPPVYLPPRGPRCPWPAQNGRWPLGASTVEREGGWVGGWVGGWMN